MPLDSTADAEITWSPQAGPQHAFIHCPVSEILFGGARGGGKSDGILGKYLIKSRRYGRDFNAIFFRKELPQADDLIDRAKQLYLPHGAYWREQAREFRMKEGGRIRFRPLENVTDAQKFMGQSLSDAAVEEAGNYETPQPIDMLFGALRSKAGVPIQLLLTANPGGPGHSWIRHRYIDPAPLGMQVLTRKLPNGSTHDYIFIPSKVQDNRILLEHDPHYVDRLYLVGSEALVKAWLEGDWNVVAGAFFPEWNTAKHVIQPMELPLYWHRFRSFDFGSARPFSVGWWAVSDGELPRFPRGALIRYREWYGAAQDSTGATIPNTGLRLTAEEIADGIRQREENDLTGNRVMGGVADPSIFAQDGGPSIADRMAARKVFFREADNARVARLGAMGGWDQLRSRLKGDGERPAIYFFSTCKDIIRTLPVQQHDVGRPEDLACWVAGTMVSTPAGERPIELLRAGDVVDTPVGPRPVLRSYLSGASEIMRVTLSDGRVLEGTPDHKIYIGVRGLVALSDLSCHMIPRQRIIWSRSLNTAVWCIAATKGASTTIRAARTSLRALAQACTVRFGLTPAIPFQTVGMFTTSTVTTTTTTFPTLRASRPPSIDASTHWSGWPRAVTFDRQARSGIALGVPNPSSALPPTRCWPTRLNGNARAAIVALLLSLDTLRSASALRLARKLCQTLRVRFVASRSGRSRTAPSGSEPVHIAAVGRSDERTLVYNLTVADAHLFYANGVLSSNTEGEDHCADECRYACMSRPYTAPLPPEMEPIQDRYARKYRPGRRYGTSWAA